MASDNNHEPLTEAEIERIITQIQDGRQEPFRLLVQQYQRRIHVYCCHMLGQQQEAEDAVQEIFIKCYQHIGRYRKQASFTAWLYRISYNHCINLLKKRNAWYKVFSSYRQQQLHDECSADYNANALVADVLVQLSSEDRSLLLLRVVDERSYEEIGQIIGCKPATARKKYERIKKKLKATRPWQMEGYANET